MGLRLSKKWKPDEIRAPFYYQKKNNIFFIKIFDEILKLVSEYIIATMNLPHTVQISTIFDCRVICLFGFCIRRWATNSHWRHDSIVCKWWKRALAWKLSFYTNLMQIEKRQKLLNANTSSNWIRWFVI